MSTVERVIKVRPTDKLKEKGLGSRKVKLNIIKKSNELPKDAEIIGFLNNQYSNKAVDKSIEVENGLFITYQDNKQKGCRVGGYYQVEDTNNFVVVTKPSLKPLILIAIIAIAIILLMVLIGPIQVPEKQEEARNVISMDDIPVDEVPQQSDMAYITGDADEVVTENQPYYYLKNDKLNEDKNYAFKFIVSVNGKEVFTSGKVMPGEAEPWDAYNCEEVKDGINDISYVVQVYDGDALVAASNVDGLHLKKQ